MSPRSGRKKIAQGEVSVTSETLGCDAPQLLEPALAGERILPPAKAGSLRFSGVIPGLRASRSALASICHPLCGFIEWFK